MARKRPLLFLLFPLLFLLFWISFTKHEATISIPISPPQTYSAPVLSILSGGHKQAMAQTLFYKTMFYNEFRAEKDELPIDAINTFKLLNIASKLDPYNMDCYYYAQAMLADQPDFVHPLNNMLLRGLRARTWDHYLPWFLGVNYFFTLKDKKKAGKYFFETARRKPEVTFYATLAARALHEGSETEIAVQILSEMLDQAPSPLVADAIRKRLTAFQTVLFLRSSLLKYHEKYQKKAVSLDELVSGHILGTIPPDPYGGTFYLAKDGSIQTSSQYVLQK